MPRRTLMHGPRRFGSHALIWAGVIVCAWLAPATRLWAAAGEQVAAPQVASSLSRKPAASSKDRPHFGPTGDAVLDARAAALGHKLRCPVCQGMPIAESPATMAVDMMQQVRRMLADGQSDESIVAYFTSRYGEWVLLEPPHVGFALWVWVLPPCMLLALAALAWRILRRLQRLPAPTPAGSRDNAAAVPQMAPAHDEAVLLAMIRDEVNL